MDRSRRALAGNADQGTRPHARHLQAREEGLRAAGKPGGRSREAADRTEHWRDVDFEGHVIRVRASYADGALTTPKSGKVRSVPMAPDVAETLAKLGQRESWTGDDDLVFVGRAGDYLDGRALRRRTTPPSGMPTSASSASTISATPSAPA